MRRLFTAFLISTFLTAGAYAECRYFRVSTKLLQCGAADAKTMDEHDPYPATADVPELEDPKAAALVKVTCDCAYSLQGSDPRCDFDQTVEKSSLLGAEDPSHSCRRGNSLCRDVCPPHLP